MENNFSLNGGAFMDNGIIWSVLVNLDTQRIVGSEGERREAFVAVSPHVVVVEFVHPHGRLLQNTCEREERNDLRDTISKLSSVK